MSSLLNKLTGHSDKTTEHHSTTGTHGATTTTTTQTTTDRAVGNTGLHGTNTTVGTGLHGTNTTGTYAAGTTQQSGLSSDNAMTRSEEQLRVNKATVEAGRAELNKTVSTEHVTQAVPVSQEKVVVEREPINASNVNSALSGPSISEAHYETSLKKDVVSAQKETVPIERIRLAKQVETGVETVDANLRKEHVSLTTDTPDKVDLGHGRTVADKVDGTAAHHSAATTRTTTH